MTNHRSTSRLALSTGSDPQTRFRAKAGHAAAAVEWRSTGEDLYSAEAWLDLGGLVYLSVESLGSAGWDWLVWDASAQVLPRHGLATNEGAAKRQAEMSMQEVNALLLDVLGHDQQGAAAM